MKKLLLLVLAITLSTGVFAQFNKYANEEVFGMADSIVTSWNDGVTTTFEYYFGHNQFGDIGFAEKYNINKSAKVRAVYVSFGGVKLTNENKVMQAFVLKDNKFTWSRQVKYKDIKLNNTKDYPNNGTGYTAFYFDSIKDVTGEFYVGVIYDEYDNLDDEILIESTEDGNRKNDYTAQNIFFVNQDGGLAYGDISDTSIGGWGVKSNLLIGAMLDFCDLTVDAGNDKTITKGDSVVLIPNITGDTTEILYAWSTTLDGSNGYVYNKNVYVKPDVTSKYYLFVFTYATSAGEDGCFDYDSVTVYVNDAPTCSTLVASINKTVNNNNTVTLSALPSIGVTYNWSTGATTQSITITPTEVATAYSVTVTLTGTTCTATASTTITGVNELDKLNSSLIVYPMPINEVLNIKFNAANDNSATISIIDIMGRVIYTEDVKSTGTVNKNINTEKFANGIYTLKIATANGNVMRKIIKN